MHSIKHRIQDLVESSAVGAQWVTPPGQPNVTTNPLPNHGGVNTLTDEEDFIDHGLFIGPPGAVVSITMEQPVEDAYTRYARTQDWVNPNVRNIMDGMGFDPTRGLGIMQQGIVEPIQASTHKCRFGTGYRPRFGEEE